MLHRYVITLLYQGILLVCDYKITSVQYILFMRLTHYSRQLVQGWKGARTVP